MKDVLVVLAVGSVLSLGAVLAWIRLDDRRDSVKPRVFVSPDGARRAVLKNLRRFVDINVQVKAGRNAWWGAPSAVYVSGDSNRLRAQDPARLLWSRDSRRLLLVGRWSLRGSAPRLANGEAPLMLHDFETGATRANGADDRGPGFSREDLAGADFGETLEWAPGPSSSEARAK